MEIIVLHVKILCFSLVFSCALGFDHVLSCSSISHLRFMLIIHSSFLSITLTLSKRLVFSSAVSHFVSPWFLKCFSWFIKCFSFSTKPPVFWFLHLQLMTIQFLRHVKT